MSQRPVAIGNSIVVYDKRVNDVYKEFSKKFKTRKESKQNDFDMTGFLKGVEASKKLDLQPKKKIKAGAALLEG